MKKVIIASDHAGYSLKEKIKDHLGKNVIDITPKLIPGDDYPLIARKASKEALKNNAKLILCCGSGHGMCMAANKVKGIRAFHAREVGDARLARNDDDANTLCLGGRITAASAAIKITDTFLKTPFAKSTRFKRRLSQIE